MPGSAENDGAADFLGDSIIESAKVELLSAKASGLSQERVAARAGVDLHEVRQRWPSTSDLLSAALESLIRDAVPMPDTGSLRGDLLAYASSINALLNTPTGLRLMDAMMGRPSEWDLEGRRVAALDRYRERFATIVRRAARRGECAPDVDAERLIDLVAFGVAIPALFHGRGPIEADAVFVVDTVLDGVGLRDGAAGAPCRD